MRKMALRTAVHPDNAHAVIELQADGDPLGSISLDTATLEKLIRKLARIRASLTERIALQLQPDEELEVIHRAPLFLRKQLWKESRVLSFRHPGYGWLAFTIADNHAESIADWLTSKSALKDDIALMPSQTRH
jgi:hypothetical protein